MSNIKITNKIQNKICVTIKAWEGKFGWKELIASLKSDYNFVITKPSLIDNDRIYKEYKAKKQEKLGVTSDPVYVDATEEKLIKIINKLETNEKKLKAAIDFAEETTSTQLAFIENMLENARAMGVDLQKLTEPRG